MPEPPGSPVQIAELAYAPVEAGDAPLVRWLAILAMTVAVGQLVELVGMLARLYDTIAVPFASSGLGGGWELVTALLWSGATLIGGAGTLVFGVITLRRPAGYGRIWLRASFPAIVCAIWLMSIANSVWILMEDTGMLSWMFVASIVAGHVGDLLIPTMIALAMFSRAYRGA